jgi:ceramide glucosyltransferase
VIASTIFGAIALLSLALLVWQFIVAMRFPLHQRIPNPTYAPDISILKPLKGCDSETRACLENWLTQQYHGRIQILFGVHSAVDPVCVIVRELILTHPQVDAELVICGKALGPNAKVSVLVQLQPLAKYNVIAVSDADVHVPEDFLSQVVTPLQNERVGLVNCFYKLKDLPDLFQLSARSPKQREAIAPVSFGMYFEAFTVNCDFWSQVLQARSLKRLDFALGAVMIAPRGCLEKVRAFDSLLDYLADDYQLGNRIARAGAEIVISPVVVECRSDWLSDGQVLQHQLRWARTIRFCQPVPYFFSVLGNVTLWSVIWLAVDLRFLPLAIALINLRILIAFFIERKMIGRFNLMTFGIQLISDLLRPLLWAFSFLGNTVVWRGRKYRVLRGGKLVPV